MPCNPIWTSEPITGYFGNGPLSSFEEWNCWVFSQFGRPSRGVSQASTHSVGGENVDRNVSDGAQAQAVGFM